MEANESKMRAVVREWGKIVFKSLYNIPSCGSNEVLVRIKAAAINPVDYKAPKIILGTRVGFDFSGVVESVGSSVTKFAAGDEVFGATKGSLADFAISDPDRIAKKPQSLSFSEAAALPVTYLTSLQGLRDYGSLKKGARILVIGASGGCGIAALQLAKSMGAGKIVAVCSGKNSDLVKSHGADEVIDYTKHNVTDYFRAKSTGGDVDECFKFDVIYDAATHSGAGEDYKTNSLELLCNEGGPNKTHGQYVAINGKVDMWMRLFTRIGQKTNQHLFLADPNTTDLECLSKLANEGWTDENGEQKRLAPVVAEFLPFSSENVDKGFELLKSRRVVGKIVFDMT